VGTSIKFVLGVHRVLDFEHYTAQAILQTYHTALVQANFYTSCKSTKSDLSIFALCLALVKIWCNLLPSKQ
jgi:hypothetical protein